MISARFKRQDITLSHWISVLILHWIFFRTHGNQNPACLEEITVTPSSGAHSWEEALILPCHRVLMFRHFQVYCLFAHSVITSYSTSFTIFCMFIFYVLISRKGWVKTLPLWCSITWGRSLPFLWDFHITHSVATTPCGLGATLVKAGELQTYLSGGIKQFTYGKDSIKPNFELNQSLFWGTKGVFLFLQNLSISEFLRSN